MGQISKNLSFLKAKQKLEAPLNQWFLKGSLNHDYDDYNQLFCTIQKNLVVVETKGLGTRIYNYTTQLAGSHKIQARAL